MSKEPIINNILIVDDIAENIKVLASILEAQNYNVKKALNGKIALRSIHSNPPDLILLDIKMPEMDGYEVCQQLKSEPQTKDIPIIFISALNEVFDKVKAFKIGAVDYITKPFQVEEVIARIESQLTIQKQKKQLETEIRNRKEAEAILYQSRALLSSILNTSLEGIGALQAVRKPFSSEIEDFRCLVINPILSKIINRNQENLAGKLVGKRIIDTVDKDLFSELVDLVENGGILEKDIYDFKSGHKNSCYHLIALKLGDGVSVTVRDITEQKQLELKLESEANVDSLTGIANRRAFDHAIAQEWKRHLRSQHALSFIICDIDYFKKYNDYYGHLKGDECLRHIAQTIDRCVKRAGEFVARYGGEEFAIILPNTNQQHALNIVRLIKQQIRELAIDHSQSDISEYVTLSFGLTTIVPREDAQLTTFINLGDKALYQAKKKGRDRIIISNMSW